MIKDFTLGQYFLADSVIHKLDPRFKISELIAFIVFIFTAGNLYSFSVMVCSVAGIMLLSGVPFKMYLKNLKMILPIVIFTAVLNALYTKEGTVIFSLGVISVSTGGILRALFISLRIILLILVSSVLTYTTTPQKLTVAIESLLSPLKFFGLGEVVHVMAMMMTIALRFIPILTDETDKIISAQKARGADMESGGIIKRLKALIPVLIPLLLSSVRRAYDLAEAMDCRCYNGGKGRTRMNRLLPKTGDYLSVLFLIFIFALVIFLNNIL